VEKHNRESLLIHVQRLKRDLDLGERKWKTELDSERNHRQNVEGELEELRTKLNGVLLMLETYNYS